MVYSNMKEQSVKFLFLCRCSDKILKATDEVFDAETIQSGLWYE